MKIIFQTQIHENYGAHGWDGKGACPQYWKAKGGTEHVVYNVPMEALYGNRLTEFCETLRMKFEEDSPYFRERVIDWFVEGDDYQTQWERDQLEFDGSIHFHSPRYGYDECEQFVRGVRIEDECDAQLFDVEAR